MRPRKNSETTASTTEIPTTAKMTMPKASCIVHHGPMWRRVRRRTMAPRRPALFPGQYGLALVTAILLLAGVAVALWAVLG